MNYKRYSGKLLHLMYPEFLEVEKRGPNWFAASLDRKTTVAIVIDPEPEAAQGFARVVRNPYFAKSGGIKVDREGYFRFDSGLEGYERIARLNDALGRAYTYGWAIDGNFKTHILNVLITTVERDWHNGSIWESLVRSIRVVT